MLSSLRREAKLANEFHIPIVISSGVDQQHLMRMPRDLSSIAYLFGLSETEALDAVSINPNNIIGCNRKKLNQNFIAPGITIVRKGSDD